MIKGLYFKLNMENQFDKEIYDFFQESKHKSKINTLYAAILAYKDVRSNATDVRSNATKEGDKK